MVLHIFARPFEKGNAPANRNERTFTFWNRSNVGLLSILYSEASEELDVFLCFIKFHKKLYKLTFANNGNVNSVVDHLQFCSMQMSQLHSLRLSDHLPKFICQLQWQLWKLSIQKSVKTKLSLAVESKSRLVYIFILFDSFKHHNKYYLF